MIRNSWDVSIDKRPVLVVDNGSYEFRAGWSLNEDGSIPELPYIIEKNQVGKPKTLQREIDSMHIIGSQFAHFEASKIQKKTSFDKNILTQAGNLEHTLDYCFQNLGINEQI